jgi:hypothetical protein
MIDRITILEEKGEDDDENQTDEHFTSTITEH